MLRNKPFWAIVGFLLLMSGILTLILSLVGLEWKPIAFIYHWGGLVSLLIQVSMMIAGFTLLFIARNPQD